MFRELTMNSRLFAAGRAGAVRAAVACEENALTGIFSNDVEPCSVP